MEQQFLQDLVKTQPENINDLNSPYSFIEWKKASSYVPEKDSYLYYNRYLLEWFAKNKQTQISDKFLLRQRYLHLFDQLQIFFSEEEKTIWYNTINLSDEKELLLSIPYFAKKLKEISLYYLDLRKNLKHVKIKYNSVGSLQGLEREIRSLLVENFTASNTKLTPKLRRALPDLSAVQNKLTIKIEELYDDTTYLDKSPTISLSSYVDIYDETARRFFATKNINLSADSWLYTELSLPVLDSVESFLNQITGVQTEQLDESVYLSYIQKYIGEDKYIVSPLINAQTEIPTYDISLAKGNNFFYYPYGVTDTSISINEQITPKSLSSLSLSDATSNEVLSGADTIFVKTGQEIKAAWLHYNQFEDQNKHSSCLVEADTTTSFIFPFPGYGLSSEDVFWTGPSLSSTEEHQYLPANLKAAVNQAYWSQTLPNDGCENLFLNKTTLAENGAKANLSPNASDKIFIREERNIDTQIPRGQLSGAWLYKFEQTSLPISSKSSQNNVVFWPYNRVDAFIDRTFLDEIANDILSDVCDPISIQKLDGSRFTAASSFDAADKIYKFDNYEASEDNLNATECCWLSSGETIVGNFKHFKQAGASLLFQPGIITRFVWSGPTAPLSSVFVGIQHQEDCPAFEQQTEIEWQNCTCKQVYYSPYGHKEETFDGGNRAADYICKCIDYPSSEFDLNSWKDSQGNSFQESSEFSWYKINEKTRNWGNGSWSTSNGTSSTMLLENGKCYVYRRFGSRTDGVFPPYVFLKNYQKIECSWKSHEYYKNYPVKWITAKKTDRGIWETANTEATAIINPGDYVKFQRQQQTINSYLSAIQVEEVSENKGSIWATFDYIPVGSSTTLNWPYSEGLFLEQNSYGSQVPPLLLQDVKAIKAWRATRITSSPEISDFIESAQRNVNALNETSYTPLFTVTVFPPNSGTYSIAVTAIDTNDVEYRIGGPNANVSTVIPNLTVVNAYKTEFEEIKITTPVASTLLEQPLTGWKYSLSDTGAKPYWAKLDSEKTSFTKQKGIRDWGYDSTYFDDYIPNFIPAISPLYIKYGNVIDYERAGLHFYWEQPITYKTFSGTPEWCKLNFTTNSPSNLSSVFDVGLIDSLKVFPTLSASDIILTNNINGFPVEVFYYAMSSFVWTTSGDPTINTQIFDSEVFYNTESNMLQNRFFPTIASLPSFKNLYTEYNVGSYFVPENLGASQYINKNFTSFVNTTSVSSAVITEDTNIHIGGRGLTLQDQPTIFDWKENNEWLKESQISKALEGTVKSSLTKTLQSFIPYQSDQSESQLGLITTKSKFTPWGGRKADQWTDKINEPRGFTGVINMSAWEATQTLKSSQKELFDWTSNIYGTQFGLFKQLTS